MILPSLKIGVRTIRIILRPDCDDLLQKKKMTHGKKYYVFIETKSQYFILNDKYERIWLHKVHTRKVPTLRERFYKYFFKKGIDKSLNL